MSMMAAFRMVDRGGVTETYELYELSLSLDFYVGVWTILI